MAVIPLLLLAPMIGIAKAPTATKVHLEPGNFQNVSPGTYLTLDVMIDNVVGLSAWEIEVKWDPFVLSAIDASEGDFLSQGGMYSTYFVFSIDLLGHRITVGDMHLTQTTTSGSGKLATLLLKTIGAGSTNLELTSTLLDNWLVPIAHSEFGSQVAVHAVCEVTGRWEDRQHHYISTDGQYNNMYAKVHNVGGIGTVNTYVTYIFVTTAGALITLKSSTVAIAQGDDYTFSKGFDTYKYGVGDYDVQVQAHFQIGTMYYDGADIKILSFDVQA